MINIFNKNADIKFSTHDSRRSQNRKIGKPNKRATLSGRLKMTCKILKKIYQQNNNYI